MKENPNSDKPAKSPSAMQQKQANQSQLAKNLRFLRSVKGLSQQKLAQEIGLKRNNIASYEAGIVEPKVTNFLKIINFFDIHPAVLLNSDLAADSLKVLDSRSDIQVEHHQQDYNGLSGHNASSRQQFLSQTKDMRKVLDGFKQFHKFRMAKWNEMSRESQLLARDFDNLISMMESLIDLNLTFVDGHSSPSHHSNGVHHQNGHFHSNGSASSNGLHEEEE